MSQASRRHSLFRPCIDLHDGKVKQIVGGTLSDSEGPSGSGSALRTNFVSTQPPSYYANLYKENQLEGGHVIMLGKGNADAAREALRAWPGESTLYVSGLSLVGALRLTSMALTKGLYRRSASWRWDYG